MAVTKKKRVSKKLRKSWRKHIDISDVNEFLEEKRLEERLGTDFETAKNEELFMIDTLPAGVKAQTSKQQKRKKLRNAPLKCHAILKQFTKVRDPIKKRNRVRSKEERQSVLNRDKVGKKLLEKVYSIRQARVDALQEEKPTKYNFNRDLWEETDDAGTMDNDIKNNEWITGDTERHLVHGTGKKPKKLPENLHRKTSVVNAVENPHPGTSYNPSFDDHVKLLNEIGTKEEKIIKFEKHIHRVTSNAFRLVAPARRDRMWLNEMSEGLPLSRKKLSKDEPDSDSEYRAVNPPTKNKEKSIQQRRRFKKEQERQEALRKQKVERKKHADISKIGTIAKQIDRTEVGIAKAQVKRKQRIKEKIAEPKRLGPLKYDEPDQDFTMVEDLTGNLRTMNTDSGNLLRDRFLSMQKRNILAPNSQKLGKRSKIKRFKRSGHTDDYMKKVAKVEVNKLGAK